MLSNGALVVSIENLNGLPDKNNLADDQAKLVAKQNNVIVKVT